MIKRLIVRPEAEHEMTEAFDWYEERMPGLGFEFLLCVEAVFNSIQRSPQQYRCVHHKEVRRALTRRFPYEIFFVEEEQSIVVLSVFHAKRNPKRWKERV